jgi:UDP-glucose 4-epimerase
LGAAMKGVDGVFDLAGLCLLHCHGYPRSGFLVNIADTLNVLETLSNNSVRWLVYLLSASVTGNAIFEQMIEDHPSSNKNF